jgi:hypothetical protein
VVAGALALVVLLSVMLPPRLGWTATITNGGVLTTAIPTLNRPYTCSELSPVGTNVFYRVQALSVDTAGSYTLTNLANSFAPNPEAFFILHQSSLNPAAPLTNCTVIDDDSAGDVRPQIIANLAVGTTYILVTTPFSNGQTGSFSNEITGPGNITLLAPGGTPAPSSTATPSSPATATGTATPSQTPTPSPTLSLSPTESPTPTVAPTVSQTPTAWPVHRSPRNRG